MQASRTTGKGAAGPLWRRVLRALFVMAWVGLMAGLSFVFFPAAPRNDRVAATPRQPQALLDDLSPLRGLRVQIPDVQVRRLDRLAVVTFTCDVFDARQDLRPQALDRVNQLSRDLYQVRDRIAVEVAGYAPDSAGASGYAIGLMRAARVADRLVAVAELPPSAIALRSLGDTETRGPADRPHAVVITIAPAEDTSPEVASMSVPGP